MINHHHAVGASWRAFLRRCPARVILEEVNDMQNDLQTLTEKQLLAELVQEMRDNTEAVEHLQAIAANIYDLQKQDMWDRY